MITTLNEWRKFNTTNKPVNENLPGMNNSVPAIDTDLNFIPAQPIPVEDVDTDTKNNIIKIGEYAKSLELSKQQTLDFIRNILVDPAQAPEDISVAFVQDHLGEITAYIDQLPDTEFPDASYQYTKDMEDNDLPFECVMYVPENNKIKKLTESLNAQIKKDKFKAVYENGIFFINSVEELNENNKKVVFDILKECNAKNIGETLKWKRKISC